MSSTRLSTFLDGVLEAGWLAAVIVTPLFFNIYSSRVFEPDKLTTLRSIAVMMAAAWLVRWVEERASGQKSLRVSWRTPLVVPVLFTVLVYLASTAVSVTPLVSFFGSYQRLQGTFTTLSYIVVFFILLDRMRSRAQVDRFVTTLILNSLPIALYGFVQHSERDPLPWGGDVTRRVASNMGNPIFIAAYMIMVVPPTLARVVDSFRSILTDEETGTVDVLRAAAYIFIFLVQVISVWYTHSRGPLMGLLAGLGVWGFLGLLMLQHAARQDKDAAPRSLLHDLGRGLAFGLGSLLAAGAAAAALYFGSRAVLTSDSDVPQWAAAITALLVLAGVWLAFVVNRQGWRWLWIGALAIAVPLIIGFLAINLVEPAHEWSQQQPWLGRLDDVLQAEGGTGKVRALIWEGALQLILPHDPIAYPPLKADAEAQPDRFNAIRPLIGYGPEAMYVAYNRFYPPLLGHHESRSASPDRSHNETLDSLVITGLLGFTAYLWLFGSLFYFGLRWLGILPDGWRRALFFALLPLGAVAAVLAVIPTVGAHFFGLAIPVGMVGGLFIYLIVYGFSVYHGSAEAPPTHPHFLLLIGMLATFAGHLIEINFGISIAATRTTFWALAGVFVILGLEKIAEQEEYTPTPQAPPPPTNKRRKRRRRRTAAPRKAQSTRLPAWLWPSLGAALIGSLIVGTLAYDFVNNVERLSDPAQILWRALTVIAIPAGQQPRVSLGILMIFGMTLAATALLSVTQMAKRGDFRERRGEEWISVSIVLILPLVLGAFFGLALAGRHASTVKVQPTTVADVLRLAEHVADQISTYYVFLAIVVILGGLALMRKQNPPGRWSTPPGALTLAAAGLSLIVLAAQSPTLGPEQTIGILRLTLFLGAAVWALFLAIVLLRKLLPSQPGQWPSALLTVVSALGVALIVFAMPVLAYQFNLQPIRADIVYKQASPWEGSNEWVVAVQHYQRAVELVPWEDFYYLYLGRAWLEYASSLEDTTQQELALRETERVLLQAQIINPLNTDHSANLARMYRRWSTLQAGRDYQQALLDISSRYYEVATDLSPHNAVLWNEWALLYFFAGDFEQAQAKINRSLELDPEFEQTWAYQADLYAAQSRTAEAVEAYEKALELNPRLTDVWLRMGDIHLQQNQLEEAAEAYRQALELKPNNFQAWRALGSVYAQLGRLEEAVEALQSALHLQPESSDAWDVHRMLAIIYSQLGQNDTALSHAQSALALAPEDQRPQIEALIQQLQQPLPEGTTP